MARTVIVKEKKSMLEKEKEILAKLIYRSKNQHKSSEKLRKMIHLHRLLKTNSDSQKIIECCKKLYVICSSDVVCGFFISLNITVMGISARVFYIYNRALFYKPIKVKSDKLKSGNDDNTKIIFKKNTVIDNIFK